MSALFERLVRNTEIPADQMESTGCWVWTKAGGGRGKAYPVFNAYCRGKHKQLKAHRAMLVLMEVGGRADLFYDLYELYGVAELEADHLCFNEPRCINPDHLRWLTKEEHKEHTRQQWGGAFPPGFRPTTLHPDPG